MIVRTLQEIIHSERDTRAKNWNSRRLLLRSDGVGFSLHDTVIHPGTATLIWYRHHVEAVYCIEGEGEIELTETGTVYPLRPGTLYTLNGHERHWLRTKTGMRMICVFNPALTGRETHDADGVYPLVSAAT